MHNRRPYAVAAFMLLITLLVTRPLAADAPPVQPADLYADPTAAATASITQILPNGTSTTQTFTSVERIALQQDVFIIHWGKGATTLLPRQFVGSITINRRTADTQPATAPAH